MTCIHIPTHDMYTHTHMTCTLIHTHDIHIHTEGKRARDRKRDGSVYPGIGLRTTRGGSLLLSAFVPSTNSSGSPWTLQKCGWQKVLVKMC